jgi:hypothetical protein
MSKYGDEPSDAEGRKSAVRDTKLSELSDAQLRSLAKRHLSGHTSVDLEGFAGLSVEQIRHLFKTMRMKRFVEEEQQYLDTFVVRARNRMSYGLEDSIDRMKARGSGADGPQIAFSADKFLIEQLLPKQEKHVVESHSTHSFDAQFTVQFNDALDMVKKITGSNTLKGNGQDITPYTLLGTEGIATAEQEAPVTELVTSGLPGSARPDSQVAHTEPPDEDPGEPGGEPEPPPSD